MRIILVLYQIEILSFALAKHLICSWVFRSIKSLAILLFAAIPLAMENLNVVSWKILAADFVTVAAAKRDIKESQISAKTALPKVFRATFHAIFSISFLAANVRGLSTIMPDLVFLLCF